MFRKGIVMRCAVILAGLLLVLALAPGAEAQKKKKNGDPEVSLPPLPDPQQIDRNISEMLAAWQIGDASLMQKYYADDVTIVSGAYEPPLQGWSNYAQAYQRLRERILSVRLDRINTLIHVKGTVAWAVYQWEMRAMADGKPFAARGHTTLTLEKRGNAWVIVHNHTSMVESSTPGEVPEPQPGQTNPPEKNN